MRASKARYGMYSTTYQTTLVVGLQTPFQEIHRIGTRWRVPEHPLLISHNVFLRQLIIVVPLDSLG